MAISTYASLQNSIVRWARKTGDMEFSDTVPDFIRLCEADINRTMRMREMEKTTTLAASSNEITLPSDYIEWRVVTAMTTPPVVMTPATRGLQAQTYANSTDPNPRYFYIAATKLVVTPAFTGNVKLDYYGEITPLTTSATSNFMLTDYPNVYLFGSLVQAGSYLGDDPRVAMWREQYEKAKAEAMARDRVSQFGRRAAVGGPAPE